MNSARQLTPCYRSDWFFLLTSERISNKIICFINLEVGSIGTNTLTVNDFQSAFRWQSSRVPREVNNITNYAWLTLTLIRLLHFHFLRTLTSLYMLLQVESGNFPPVACTRFFLRPAPLHHGLAHSLSRSVSVNPIPTLAQTSPKHASSRPACLPPPSPFPSCPPDHTLIPARTHFPFPSLVIVSIYRSFFNKTSFSSLSSLAFPYLSSLTSFPLPSLHRRYREEKEWGEVGPCWAKLFPVVTGIEAGVIEFASTVYSSWICFIHYSR